MSKYGILVAFSQAYKLHGGLGFSRFENHTYRLEVSRMLFRTNFPERHQYHPCTFDDCRYQSRLGLTETDA
jgi:hypothetical protein